MPLEVVPSKKPQYNVDYRPGADVGAPAPAPGVAVLLRSYRPDRVRPGNIDGPAVGRVDPARVDR